MILNYDHTTQRYLYMLDRFQRHRLIGKKTRNELYHPAIRLLRRICPSSIILRNYCLRDILSGKVEHTDTIERLTNTLSYDGAIWSEGYSCWRITKKFLVEWGKLNKDNLTVLLMVRDIDTAFCKTAYKRKGVLYPATFGDLKDEPLEEALQNHRLLSPDYDGGVQQQVGPVTKVHNSNGKVFYHIKPAPVGLNTAVPCTKERVRVIEGFPYGFPWHKSDYDKYYDQYLERSSFWLRFKDTFRKERLWKTTVKL